MVLTRQILAFAADGGGSVNLCYGMLRQQSGYAMALVLGEFDSKRDVKLRWPLDFHKRSQALPQKVD